MSSQIKEIAKSRLKDNRWPMVLAALIPALLSGLSSGLSSVANGENTDPTTAKIIFVICFALTLFVINIIAIGVCKYFRANILHNEEVSTVSDGFKTSYGRNVGAMFLMSLLTALGMICLIVPGVMLALGFSLVPYILAEDAEIGTIDALKKSWNLMKGFKWEYFVLQLSFVGWFILDILTLGILGIFYVHPYYYQTLAIYCDRIMARTDA